MPKYLNDTGVGQLKDLFDDIIDALSFITSVSVNGNDATVSDSVATVTIPDASSSSSGVMSSSDKQKLDGIAAGAAVTGVKGTAESEYRTGNVNIAPADIGIGSTIAQTLIVSANTAEGVAANASADVAISYSGFTSTPIAIPYSQGYLTTEAATNITTTGLTGHVKNLGDGTHSGKAQYLLIELK